MTKFFSEIKQRIALETPPFFRKLSAIFIYIGTACIIVQGASVGMGDNMFSINHFPHWAQEAIQIGAFVGWITGIALKLPVCEPDKINKK